MPALPQETSKDWESHKGPVILSTVNKDGVPNAIYATCVSKYNAEWLETWKVKAVKIPYDQLSPEALQGVIEGFVTRDGTDYGEVEIPLETKIAQVMAQIRSGKAVIVFDQETESCTVLRSDDPLVRALGWALVRF